MAAAEFVEQVVLSTTASKVPLHVEDPQTVKVIAEVFKPGGRVRPRTVKPPPDAARPRRRTGAECNVELAGHDERHGIAPSPRGGGAPC